MKQLLDRLRRAHGGGMKRHAKPVAIPLQCPACGRLRLLRGADDLPPQVVEVRAPCPDCAGHGPAPTEFVFADGHSEYDTLPVAAATQTRMRA
ncbi:MAG: hypothetical protein QM639_20625 [Rhodocyclaceae bacterium]